ncbi:hypothetical protein Hanom_Chr11g01027321 [Helianthus anomalus]
MLSVSNRITNHILQKYLQNTTRFLINQPTNSLDSTSSRQPSNSRLCYSLNVVAEDFSVTLRSTLSKTLSALSPTRHVLELKCVLEALILVLVLSVICL